MIICNNAGVALKSTLAPVQTARYAGLLLRLVASARSMVRSVDAEVRHAPARSSRCSIPVPQAAVLRFTRACVRGCAFTRASLVPCLTRACLTLPCRAQNDLVFLRMRTLTNEIMVAPDKDFVLVVIQSALLEETG